MQRKLLALAVASAFAVPGAAIAQVTISGAFRYSVDAVKWTDSSGAANVGSGVSKWGVTGHSANIRFASRENLGGGLTGWMALESGFAPGRANGANFGWFGRNSAVGLESTSWGTVLMGQWDSPYKSIDGAWSIGTPAAYSYSATAPIFGRGDTTGTMPNPNCTANISGAGFIDPSAGGVSTTYCAYSAGSGTAFQRRLANVVQWWSPRWNNVQLLIAVETNDVKANRTIDNVVAGTITKADPSLWSAALRWDQAKWSLVGGYEHHKNFNANFAGTNRLGKDTGLKIGGNYDFGPARVSLAYERLNYDVGTVTTPTDHRERNWSIGLAVPVGNGAIKSQYARGKVTGNNTATTSAANGRLFNLSYEYNLSKRSLLYVAYAKLSQDSGSARNFGTNLQGPNGWQQNNLGAGSDPRFISFGMNHNF